jgi:hypothetical protein
MRANRGRRAPGGKRVRSFCHFRDELRPTAGSTNVGCLRVRNSISADGILFAVVGYVVSLLALLLLAAPIRGRGECLEWRMGERRRANWRDHSPAPRPVNKKPQERQHSAGPLARHGTDCLRREVQFPSRHGIEAAWPRRTAARFTRARPGYAGRAHNTVGIQGHRSASESIRIGSVGLPPLTAAHINFLAGVEERLRALNTHTQTMSGYRATEIRIPKSETEFEKNCVILFRELLNDPNVKRLGTKGQKQHGVDIVGHRNGDPNHLVGIQCKLKTGSSKLTKKEVQDEIKDALKYQPLLKEYFIVTTSKDDTKLDQYAQQAMNEQKAKGRPIHIAVWGWDTLQEKIDQSEPAKQAFDPGFSPSLASQGKKLDAIIAGQEKLATKDQIEALAKSVVQNVDVPARLPAEYADREMTEKLSKALRRRGFAKTETPKELAALANRAIDGDLCLGSIALRSEICDRAARSNVAAQTLEEAKRFRDCAAQFDSSRDLSITNALLIEAEGNPDVALRELREREEPDARSALFLVLERQRGVDEAIQWVRDAKLKPVEFNALGALNLVLRDVDNGDFDSALARISEMPSTHYDLCPAFYLLTTQLTLASIMPADQKAALFQGLPLNPRVLQLAGGEEAQEEDQICGGKS